MYLTHDGIVTTDSGGGVDFSSASTVTVDDLPDAYGDAFNTDEFYVLEDRVVARPIVQTYHTDDGAEQWGKPRSELQKAAWSVDNKPLTLHHPDTPTGRARYQHVHGVFRDAWYDDDADALRADAYVPETDEDAIEYLAANDGVSIGFTHEARPAEEDDLAGVQTDILVDHVAVVPEGRCSTEDGCSIAADFAESTEDSASAAYADGYAASDGHGLLRELADTQDNMRTFTASDGPAKQDIATDAPSGIYVTDGEWFAVGPDDHTKDSTDHPDDAMYPVGSCSDVSDAWKLRSHGEDLTIEQSTLENRIQRAAEAQDCDIDTDTDMGDIEFDADDLTVDALAERHDGVANLLEERNEYREDAQTLDEIEETLDVDDTECACDAVAELKEDAESYKDELLDYREDERQEVISDIEEYTSRFEGEYDDLSLDELREIEDTVSSVAEEVAETDTSPTGVETDSEETDTEREERVNRAWLRDD